MRSFVLDPEGGLHFSVLSDKTATAALSPFSSSATFASVSSQFSAERSDGDGCSNDSGDVAVLSYRLASDFEDFAAILETQGFAFVPVEEALFSRCVAQVKSLREQVNAPGNYCRGPLGQLRFSSKASQWVERYLKEKAADEGDATPAFLHLFEPVVYRQRRTTKKQTNRKRRHLRSMPTVTTAPGGSSGRQRLRISITLVGSCEGNAAKLAAPKAAAIARAARAALTAASVDIVAIASGREKEDESLEEDKRDDRLPSPCALVYVVDDFATAIREGQEEEEKGEEEEEYCALDYSFVSAKRDPFGCWKRLRCLLQGLCPSFQSHVQIAMENKGGAECLNARVLAEVNQADSDTATFLACPAATSHPVTLTLCKALCLVRLYDILNRETASRLPHLHPPPPEPFSSSSSPSSSSPSSSSSSAFVVPCSVRAEQSTPDAKEKTKTKYVSVETRAGYRVLRNVDDGDGNKVIEQGESCPGTSAFLALRNVDANKDSTTACLVRFGEKEEGSAATAAVVTNVFGAFTADGAVRASLSHRRSSSRKSGRQINMPPTAAGKAALAERGAVSYTLVNDNVDIALPTRMEMEAGVTLAVCQDRDEVVHSLVRHIRDKGRDGVAWDANGRPLTVKGRGIVTQLEQIVAAESAKVSEAAQNQLSKTWPAEKERMSGHGDTLQRCGERRKKNTTTMSLGIPPMKLRRVPQCHPQEYEEIWEALTTALADNVVSDAMRNFLTLAVVGKKAMAEREFRGLSESDFFPAEITRTGDWLATHHRTITARAAVADSAAVSAASKRGHQSTLTVVYGTTPFPLHGDDKGTYGGDVSIMEASVGAGNNGDADEGRRASRLSLPPLPPKASLSPAASRVKTLSDFVHYYLLLICYLSNTGTVIGDAVFRRARVGSTAAFIAHVVFARGNELAKLFEESDNEDGCLWRRPWKRRSKAWQREASASARAIAAPSGRMKRIKK